MPKLCLFCDNKAGNREHLWPQWIHARKDFGPLRMNCNQSQQIIIPNPEITVGSVCATCNNGWMSDLETKNIPIVGSMFSDLSITLDRSQQEIIASWTIKTSMILNSTRSKDTKRNFYRKQDCIAMRESLAIPEHTTVWIGRIDNKYLVGNCIDHRYLTPDTYKPYARTIITTVVVGHFVVQSITTYKLSKFVDLGIPTIKPEGEELEAYLTQVWPIERESLTWPPAGSFTNGGPNGIAYLSDRWKTGKEVDSSAFADLSF